MNARMQERVRDLGTVLEELRAILPRTLKDYRDDHVVKAASERYFERVVEGMTDLAFMLIKSGRFRIPEDDTDAFTVLAEERIIESALAERLRAAKRMRNLIVHQYARVNDELVFEALTTKILDDAASFLEAIRKR